MNFYFQNNLNTGVSSFPQLMDEQFENLTSVSKSFVNSSSEASRRSGAAFHAAVSNWINASKAIFASNKESDLEGEY